MDYSESVSSFQKSLDAYATAEQRLQTTKDHLKAEQYDADATAADQTVAFDVRVQQRIGIEILQGDVKSQTAQLVVQHAQLARQACELKNQVSGDLSGKIGSLIEQYSAEIRGNYSVPHLQLPLATFASARNEVMGLRNLESRLSYSLRGDNGYRDFLGHVQETIEALNEPA